jgi:hypothetical protein
MRIKLGGRMVVCFWVVLSCLVAMPMTANARCCAATVAELGNATVEYISLDIDGVNRTIIIAQQTTVWWLNMCICNEGEDSEESYDDGCEFRRINMPQPPPLDYADAGCGWAHGDPSAETCRMIGTDGCTAPGG